MIRSDGSVGGFFGDTEGKMAEEKIKLLESEEVKIVNGKIADDGYILWLMQKRKIAWWWIAAVVLGLIMAILAAVYVNYKMVV